MNTLQGEVVGMNHKVAPLSIREQLSIPKQERGSVLTDLTNQFSLRQAVLLSTCNRIELYFQSHEDTPDADRLFRKFIQRRGANWEETRELFYHYSGREVVEHLFHVAGGLDSMIVGETEILHQVKSAYQCAKKHNTLDKSFHLLFQEAMTGAKRIHDQTSLSDHKTSVGGVAVEFVENIFGSLNNKRVLMVGAGKTATLCLEHLYSLNPSTTYISNRSYDKAKELAERWDAKAAPMELLEELLVESDVILVCTAASEPILTHDLLEETLEQRDHDPLCVLDLSVPRNVESSCEQMDQVYLFNIDDLEGIVAENLENRSDEVEAARDIIQRRVRTFRREKQKRQLDPFIKDLHTTVGNIVEQEMDRTLNRMQELDEDQEKEIQQFAHRLKQKILHRPISSLKQEVSEGNGFHLLDAARSLFRLEDGADSN